MDGLATSIDIAVERWLDPVGIPISFYVILGIGGFLACLSSYFAEVKDEFNVPQVPPVGEGFQFKTFSIRLVQSYTMVICCAYLLHGLSFNLSLVAGISILAGKFNKDLFNVLGDKLPEMLGTLLNKYK